jgi:hypothetical protein
MKKQKIVGFACFNVGKKNNYCLPVFVLPKIKTQSEKIQERRNKIKVNA